jgi:dihydroxy-acid dehydratase
VIRPLDRPICAAEAIAILSGNLAPQGAAIKLAAATPRLTTHRGPALVFDSLKDLAERIDHPDLPVTPDHVMVLRNAGPIGAPGMPEAGALPIPKKLGAIGVTDMVRISDARMSGTAFGTVVLHIAPEAAAGGPLALVRDGDIITLDSAKRRLDLQVDEAELAKRRAAWKAPAKPARGYTRLYVERVTQADKGCDFDFLGG